MARNPRPRPPGPTGKEVTAKILDTRIPIYIAEYVANGGKGAAAAIKAGCPESGAGVQSTRWLREPNIRSAIEDALRDKIQRIDKRGDQVILELFRILSADIGQAFTPEGALKSIHAIPEDLRRAIAGFEVEELFASKAEGGAQIGVLKKVKFWSKTESANLLGKHLKLWAAELGIDLGIDFAKGNVKMVLSIKT